MGEEDKEWNKRKKKTYLILAMITTLFIVTVSYQVIYGFMFSYVFALTLGGALSLIGVSVTWETKPRTPTQYKLFGRVLTEREHKTIFVCLFLVLYAFLLIDKIINDRIVILLALVYVHQIVTLPVLGLFQKKLQQNNSDA